MQTILWNKDWNFKEKNATSSASVSIPHTVAIEPLHVAHNVQGEFIYEKHFSAPIIQNGERVLLKFEAVMMNCKVFVNDTLLKRHFGGYLPFVVDITDAVRPDKENIVRIEVDNRDDKNTPPGKPTDDLDFLYYGGIYRNVYLEIVPAVYLTDAMDASVERGGIQITTEQKNNKSIVSIRENIKNTTADTKNVKVQFTLYDGDTNLEEKTQNIAITSQKYASPTVDFIVKEPKLWSCAYPHLYRVETKIITDSMQDSRNTTFGIRELEVKTDGLYLNQQKIKLFGLNRGQQFPYIGIAASDAAQRREAKMLKQSGINCLRLSHYPQSPAFIDECDRLGILLIDPVPGWQFLGGKIWQQRLEENLIELVRRDRNHPSIAIFEVTPNETNWSTKAGDAFLHHLHELVKQESPKALTGGDTVGRKNAMRVGFDVPYYGKDGRNFLSRKLYPDQRMFLKREYGDWSFGGNKSTSRVSRKDGEKAMQRQTWNFQFSHNDNYREGQILGDLIWEAIDHNRGYYPDAPISKSGIFDIFRVPKLSYQFVRSQQKAKTESDYVLFMQALTWENKDKLVFYSNADKVELYAESQKIAEAICDHGEDKPFDKRKSKEINDNYWMTKEDHIATSEKPCLLAKHVMNCSFDGGNCQHMDFPPFTFTHLDLKQCETITAKAFKEDKLVQEEVYYKNQKAVAFKIEAQTHGLPLQADDNDFVFVYVYAVDADGHLDVTYNEKIALSVQNGDTIGHSSIEAENGVAAFMIKAHERAQTIECIAQNTNGISAKETFKTN